MSCSGDWRYVETHSTIASQVSLTLCTISCHTASVKKVVSRLGPWSLHDLETPPPLGTMIASAALQILGKAFIYVPVLRSGLRDDLALGKKENFPRSQLGEASYAPASTVVTEICWHSGWRLWLGSSLPSGGWGSTTLACLGWLFSREHRRGGYRLWILEDSATSFQCPNDYLACRGQRSRLSRAIILVKLLWGQRAAI